MILNNPTRVLVVEDETLIRMDIAETLSAAGFDILEAANADQAIWMLERHSDIRIICTDKAPQIISAIRELTGVT